MMNEILIELCGVGTCYGDTIVLENIDLQVRRGEVLALVGGSGSGKTTLLRQMTGLAKPTSGEVRVLGTTLDENRFMEQRALRQRWGVLFQFGALFSSLSVGENIALPLRERGGLTEAEINTLMRMRLLQVGLQADDATKMPAELSGGMVKRVALARALILDAELLFLDEPTSGLDPVAAGQFVELIQSLQHQQQITVIMITHDVERMEQLIDRVAVLADRTLIATGTLSEVAAVQHPFIQEYFGSHVMTAAAGGTSDGK